MSPKKILKRILRTIKVCIWRFVRKGSFLVVLKMLKVKLINKPDNGTNLNLSNISFHWPLSIPPKNIRKPLAFWYHRKFSGGIERDQWHEISWRPVLLTKTVVFSDHAIVQLADQIWGNKKIEIRTTAFPENFILFQGRTYLGKNLSYTAKTKKQKSLRLKSIVLLIKAK